VESGERKPESRKRVPGSAKGKIDIRPDFDEPLPDDVLQEFERGETLKTENSKLRTQNYKAILFDLDGTLVDSVPIILRAFREVHEQMGLSFDEAAVRKLVGIPLQDQAVMFAGDRADEFTNRYVPLYLGYQTAGMRLFPGTIEMLDELKRRGYRLGLVTSKSTRGAGRALDQTGIADRFDVIVTADDTRNRKPHPDPILKGLEALNVRPDEALYVGDSLFDVDAAQRAEVDMAAVSWGARSKEDLLLECPDRVFDSWPDFLAWLPPSVPPS